MNGIFLLDKPLGISSNLALQKVKRLFSSATGNKKLKAGHTGSLDPLATGMLPICLGEATKFSQYLLDADKTYAVAMQLGVRTTTSDAEGDIVSEREVPAVTVESIDAAFDFFRGETQQIPSMFSALKHDGKKLYEYARQGITIDRPSRAITIYELTVLSIENNTVHFIVKCSKGTYVRTLVDDFGERLGCGAHVTQLRRLSVAGFSENKMMTLEQLSTEENPSQFLIPMDASVSHFPAIHVSTDLALSLKQGKKVQSPDIAHIGLVRLMENGELFFGMGEVLEEGALISKRLIVTSI
jgi:tRNA pseudouridine55 synthase